MKTGRIIKEIRNSKSIKQGDLADMCGISQVHLSNIENEKTQPGLEVLNKIAGKLEVSVAVIMVKSISEEDVAEEKRKEFNVVYPALEKMIEAFS